MNFSEQIRLATAAKHLLKHPFYQAWLRGELTKETLQDYSVQYIPFVDAFPRFVSAVHSRCEHMGDRRLLLQNLIDEEGENVALAHPQLWRDFAEGMGVSDTVNIQTSDEANKLKDCFLDACFSSYEEGLCALYAYEHQIPEVAEAKIQGLKDFYNVTDDKTTKFFAVHELADKYHSEACAAMIDKIPAEKRERAMDAAIKSTDALWDFLSQFNVPACEMQ